jgi:hypothetical protein
MRRHSTQRWICSKSETRQMARNSWHTARISRSHRNPGLHVAPTPAKRPQALWIRPGFSSAGRSRCAARIESRPPIRIFRRLSPARIAVRGGFGAARADMPARSRRRGAGGCGSRRRTPHQARQCPMPFHALSTIAARRPPCLRSVFETRLLTACISSRSSPSACSRNPISRPLQIQAHNLGEQQAQSLLKRNHNSARPAQPIWKFAMRLLGDGASAI